MKKVLVIDDNLLIRQVLQISLSYFGWDIVAALIAKPFEPVMLSQQIARVLCQDLPHSKQENTPLTARSIVGNSGTEFY